PPRPRRQVGQAKAQGSRAPHARAFGAPALRREARVPYASAAFPGVPRPLLSKEGGLATKRARGGLSALDGFFKISERGSTVRTEIVAGLATWLTMAYILFVNPTILGSVKDSTGASLPFPQVLTVTALVAGVLTLAMGLFANYPFALAAGLGLNAFVAFTLVGANHLTWPQAMGVIVLEGLVITALVVTGFREAVLNAIPLDLKRAIGIGIGLFIAFIGFTTVGNTGGTHLITV